MFNEGSVDKCSLDVVSFTNCNVLELIIVSTLAQEVSFCLEGFTHGSQIGV